MQLLGRIRRSLAYAGRHYTPAWRYLFNLKSTVAYRWGNPALGPEEARLLERLNRAGLTMSTVEELPGISPLFDELAAETERLQSEWADRIEAARKGTEQGEIGRKTFLLNYLGERVKLDPASIFARFALHPTILRIANAYFGMYTQLRYYNIWHTLTTNGPPRESQLWHYDREDHLILKVFVYLSPIDEEAGPFTYAPGTHRKGTIDRVPESFLENGVPRWGDREMEAVVPSSRWVTATGDRGTVVFADTRGYHKGGLARGKDRLLYTCLYTSPTSGAPELFERPATIPDWLDEAQKRALGLPARGILG